MKIKEESFSLPGGKDVYHRREHHQRGGLAGEAGAGLMERERERIEKMVSELKRSWGVEVEFFPFALFFRPLSSTLLSLFDYYLHTSSRNAALMACMRSIGTLATLDHCFFGEFFFEGGQRKKERGEGGASSAPEGGGVGFRRPSTSCRIFWIRIVVAAPVSSSFNCTESRSVTLKWRIRFLAVILRGKRNEQTSPEGGNDGLLIRSFRSPSSIDGAPSR